MKRDFMIFFAGACSGMAGAEIAGMLNPQPVSWTGYAFWMAMSVGVWMAADRKQA